MFHMKKKRYGPLYVEAHFKGIPWESKDHQKIGNLTKDYFLRFGNLNHPKLGTMILIVGSTSRFNK